MARTPAHLPAVPPGTTLADYFRLCWGPNWALCNARTAKARGYDRGVSPREFARAEWTWARSMADADPRIDVTAEVMSDPHPRDAERAASILARAIRDARK